MMRRAERRMEMNWKHAAFTTLLLGAVLVAVAGCGNDSVTTTAPQPAATTGSQLTVPPSNSGTMPKPPSDNGTMPQPPQGFTPGERPATPEIDWAVAAAKLGVTEEQLKEAVGDLQSAPPDLAAAANKLGVTEDALRETLGFSAGGAQRPGGPPQNGAPPDQPEPPQNIY
jgi:hypothetical protein